MHDPTCVAPQVLQFRPAIWQPRGNHIQQLLPLPGDTAGAATAINDRSQAVGISGICDRAVGRRSAIHAVLWERDAVIDLGNIGGDAWNTPMAINLRGDIVGFANTAPGIGFSAHAFLWTRSTGKMVDLGTLPGDTTSQALGINEWRQIVGTSCDVDFNCRAFLWENGVMTDLNTLVAPGYTDPLFVAGDINDFGKITGEAFDESAGNSVPFVATPLRKYHGNTAKRSASGKRAVLSDAVKDALMQRIGVSREDLVR